MPKPSSSTFRIPHFLTLKRARKGALAALETKKRVVGGGRTGQMGGGNKLDNFLISKDYLCIGVPLLTSMSMTSA